MDTVSAYPFESLAPVETGPRPVRVMVVDDSAYVRFTLGKHLADAPGLKVVGAARDGREAVQLIPRINPDVVTLDVDMPRCDGLTALREIMVRFPRPVIMLSSLTSEGASETIQALTLGAVDFVTKPTARNNIAAIMEDVISKIHTAAQAQVTPFNTEGRETQPAAVKPRQVRPLARRDRVVVIGASTGGARALSQLLPALPADLPAAVVIVQHMPVGFTRSLADRLNSTAGLAVKEAAPGDMLEAGQALLAPAGFHLVVDESGRIILNRTASVHGVRPAVDVTMASVAQRFGPAAIGVVLTGAGHDGANGAAQIHAAGGYVIAEAESSCMVWSMSRSVAEAGVADVIAPLSDIGAAIDRAARL